LLLASRLRRFFTARLGREDGVKAAIAMLAGAALIALTNAVAIAVVVPWPQGGLGLRAAHHLFDALQTMGLGALFGALVGLGAAFLPLPLWALLGLYTAVSVAGMLEILGPDLRRQSYVVFGGRVEHPLFEIYLLLCGLAPPVAHLLGAFFARFRWLRVVPVGAAIIGIGVHHAILRDDYPGLHGAVAVVAGILAGATIAPWIFERLWTRARPRARRAALAAAGLTAAFALFIHPSNSVRLELFREPGAVAAWALAGTVWSIPEVPRPASPPSSPWLASRADLAPIPPSSPRLLLRAPVVVLLTVDAVRADVIDDPKRAAALPILTQLKRSGVYFPRATSPGSQTSVSLTTAFSGRYFSQLFWRLHGVGASRFAYAARDPSPRFPEILTAHGVRTMSACSLNFLAGDFGIARGFAEEDMVALGRNHAPAKPVVDALLRQLNGIEADQPAFLFAHLTEPHEPYDRGNAALTKAGKNLAELSAFERYVAEITVADAEIGRVLRVLTTRFADRGVLIVTSDHGEAFGEHGTWHHTKTLYEELLRVPLIVRAPGLRSRRVEQHVGLVDLGPTILDIFGVEAPPSFMGQSLVPLLRGGSAKLDRPILAEGRLRRALYSGKLKVIEDLRRKVIEAYDLDADPGETQNLAPDGDPRVAEAFATLHAFFEAHAARAPGYRPPFKP
jgi:arylsulfatase A-like enzyme